MTAMNRAIDGTSGKRLAINSCAVTPPAFNMIAINGILITIVKNIGRNATIAASQVRILAAPFGACPLQSILQIHVCVDESALRWMQKYLRVRYKSVNL